MRLLALALCLAVPACSSSGHPARGSSDTTRLTERQRDSVIGASRLPGARGIQKAQRAQDSAAAQAARADSIR